jgi:ADP-dependent NAD(P)H-hydrate dehydratase / NAD(P)H-hydrate epimerase
MKLLTATQIKAWDQYTIENEPIVMERASLQFVEWYTRQREHQNRCIVIICGNGNNGGDGLAIARMLRDRLYDVEVLVLRFLIDDTIDFNINLRRLLKYDDVKVNFIEDQIIKCPSDSIIIDALLGTGTNKPVTGKLEQIIQYINSLPNKTISIDVPSGLPADGMVIGTTVMPDVIFTFQIPKKSFFLEANEAYCKSWVLGDIHLHLDYLKKNISDVHLSDLDLVSEMYKTRKKYQHKGHFGHAMIIAGSEGKMGAAILATKACLRSGAGLVTACVPEIGRDVMQTAFPEAMIDIAGKQHLNSLPKDVDNFTIGIGPGLGVNEETIQAFIQILKSVKKPLVLDADAINILSMEPALMEFLPDNSILTPHPKEFARLFGSTESEVERLSLAKNMAVRYQIIIVLKGAHTRIFTPYGHEFINNTGNPGMATAGSGDVLTGIITGLLAQNYTPENAAVLGVYVHGLAGDMALKYESVESLIASDIINNLGKAFKTLIPDDHIS